MSLFTWPIPFLRDIKKYVYDAVTDEDSGPLWMITNILTVIILFGGTGGLGWMIMLQNSAPLWLGIGLVCLIFGRLLYHIVPPLNYGLLWAFGWIFLSAVFSVIAGSILGFVLSLLL